MAIVRARTLTPLAARRRSVGALVIAFALVAAHVLADTPTLEALLTKKAIYLRDVRKLPYKMIAAHGPLLTASVDSSSEIRFFYVPVPYAPSGLWHVVLVARGKPNDENNGTIIWPQKSVGRDFGQELRAIYNR